MESSDYWFMTLPGSWLELEIQCRVERPNRTSLVVLENRAEQDCLVKYITDEFNSVSGVRYAIGLQSPDHYRGVYQWRPSDTTPTFTNWASASPTNKECVVMTVGSGASQNGAWTDVSCQMDTKGELHHYLLSNSLSLQINFLNLTTQEDIGKFPP